MLYDIVFNCSVSSEPASKGGRCVEADGNEGMTQRSLNSPEADVTRIGTKFDF